MPLERQSIEKKDFPIGRRGYDPDAVDAHLAAVADQVDELRRSSRRRTETLASAASEQVKAIVEAAESSAAEIQRAAEEEAAEIREEARREAQDARQRATSEAREYVGRVSESTAGMLQRVDAMESELGALLEALRTGANRINADLQLLDGNLGEVRDAVAPREPFEPEAPSVAKRSPGGDRSTASRGFEPDVTPAGGAFERDVEPEPTASALAGPAAPPVPPAPPVTEAPRPSPTRRADPAPSASAEAAPAAPSGLGGSALEADDTEGARLIALNMALNGTPREETDRYLAENFSLSDRESLLEEVYASVEG